MSTSCVKISGMNYYNVSGKVTVMLTKLHDIDWPYITDPVDTT